MRILIAEDEALSRRMLEAALVKQGFDVEAVDDGDRALEKLSVEDGPRLAILDWMMPRMDGDEVCRRLRTIENGRYRYLILLTSKAQKEDVVRGLEAGADDYLVKPFDPQELRSRIRTGVRVLDLETRLADKVDELQEALVHVKTLQGLLPICMHCKKIRDDSDTWHRLETYISENSGAAFTHSLCEECLEQYYPKSKRRAAARGGSNGGESDGAGRPDDETNVG